MDHPLLAEAVLRTAVRRGFMPADDAARLGPALAGCLRADLGARLREAGARAVAERLPELLAPDGHRGFGPWLPLARLGGGAMGAIWLAVRGDGPLVVVKTASLGGRPPIIDAEAGGSVWNGGAEVARPSPEAELSLRFAREARITASMDHPRIVPCLDGGVSADGARYLVLAWVPDGDLGARLRRDGPLQPACALAIADQLADALEHAHARGVVHRDLKAANVFIRPDGSVLLGDFGLARPTAAGATRFTLAGVAVGTPSTMAPEQIDGRDAIDGRADLYALGCLLHECLTGRPPYVGRSADVMHQHRMRAAPDLDAQVPGLPTGTADLVARLMSKSPADRPADAGEVRTLLIPLLHACGAAPGQPLPLDPDPADAIVRPDPLLLLGDGGDPAVVLWPGDRLVLGKHRAPGTDLVVRDYPEEQHRERIARISRRHARIAIDHDGQATIEDLGSANGTCVGNERLPPHVPYPIPPGGMLHLAGVFALRLQTTAGRTLVLRRVDNRPGLAYALVPAAISIGGPGCDIELSGASRRVELRWGADGWTADGAAAGCIDLHGLLLRAQPLGNWL